MKTSAYKIIILLLIFLFSCKKDETVIEPNIVPEGKVSVTGQIDFPGGSSGNGYSVKAGLNEGKINNNRLNINLEENKVQLVGLYNSSDEPVLLNIAIAESGGNDVDLNAVSTTESLVFLNPLVCSSDPDEAKEIISIIRNLPSYQMTVSVIQNQLNLGTLSLNESNTELTASLKIIYEDFFQVYNAQLSKSWSNQNSPQTIVPNPDFEVNGLKVEDLSSIGNEIKFSIRNNKKRWIAIYLDKSNDGIHYDYSPNIADIIPSTSISVFSLLLHGSFIDPVSSGEIQTTQSSGQKTAVRCYGIGIGNFVSDLEFERTIFPAGMSVVFDMIIPTIEVIFGIKWGPELRGAPSGSPALRIAEKIAEKFISDALLKARIFRWYSEGRVDKVLSDVVSTSYSVIINEPNLVTDLLIQSFGANVTRAIINNYLFPLRLASGALTAANIAYSISSALSTEAVTSFILEDELANNFPVRVSGSVKDFTNNTGVSNATVSVFNPSGSQITTVITNSSGLYEFMSPTGELTLRIIASGYLAVAQEIQVPAELAGQNPAVYYPSVTWLTPFSQETGNLEGFVRDATNLNFISGVNINLKYRVNDPDQAIVAETSSDGDGSYTFSNIPAGTYTAYFNKVGYISDFLVVNIIGNTTTSGADITLSPNIVTDGGYRIVLTWGASPQDLDSHLFTPLINGSSYHVFWNYRGNLSSPPYAQLDVDDVNAYGPETITINEVFPGTYHYSVYQYSSYGELTNSGATVSLYGQNGFIRSWNVPLNGDGRWWNVFELNGSNGQITSINQINDYSPAGKDKKWLRDLKAKKAR